MLECASKPTRIWWYACCIRGSICPLESFFCDIYLTVIHMSMNFSAYFLILDSCKGFSTLDILSRYFSISDSWSLLWFFNRSWFAFSLRSLLVLLFFLLDFSFSAPFPLGLFHRIPVFFLKIMRAVGYFMESWKHGNAEMNYMFFDTKNSVLDAFLRKSEITPTCSTVRAR